MCKMTRTKLAYYIVISLFLASCVYQVCSVSKLYFSFPFSVSVGISMVDNFPAFRLCFKHQDILCKGEITPAISAIAHNWTVQQLNEFTLGFGDIVQECHFETGDRKSVRCEQIGEPLVRVSDKWKCFMIGKQNELKYQQLHGQIVFRLKFEINSSLVAPNFDSRPMMYLFAVTPQSGDTEASHAYFNSLGIMYGFFFTKMVAKLLPKPYATRCIEYHKLAADMYQDCLYQKYHAAHHNHLPTGNFVDIRQRNFSNFSFGGYSAAKEATQCVEMIKVNCVP